MDQLHAEFRVVRALVGNVPTSMGAGGTLTIQPGSLLILDRTGKQIASLTNQLNDPSDLTIDDDFDHATVFVSNVNNNTTPQKNGTVTRLTLAISDTAVTVTSTTVIAKGYTVEPNAAALVLGPTGLAYDERTDTLYVLRRPPTMRSLRYPTPAAGPDRRRVPELAQSSFTTISCAGPWRWLLRRMEI